MAVMRSVLGAFLGICAAMPVLADFNEGFSAYLRKDYARALEEWRPLAEQGHAAAQNNLAGMYDKGKGVPVDQVQAYVWYSIAANLFPEGKDRW